MLTGAEKWLRGEFWLPMDFDPASSLVNRPTRPTEPLGRSVGSSADSWSALSGRRTRSTESIKTAIADIVDLKSWGRIEI